MSEDERVVRREVTLHADREEVWEALTDPEVMRRWLADEAELEPREGGEVVLRYDGGEERHGRVEEIVREQRLRIRWRREPHGESEVDFVLADAAAGTRLVVVESAPVSGPRSSLASWDDRLFTLEVMALERGAVALLAA